MEMDTQDYIPQLYTKLIYWAKDKRCDTVFYGPGDKEMDPRTIEGGFNLIPTMQIDSMYIGDKISYQHKIYDGTVRFREKTPKKRLAPKNNQPVDESTNSDAGSDAEDSGSDLSSASE